MPEAAGVLGYGTTVRVGRGATPTWTKLALVGDIELPVDEIDEVEVTHMESPGRRRQYISGLIDSGEMTVPMNLVPGSPTDLLLQSIRDSGEQVLVEVTLPEADPETYSGYLSGYSRSAPVQDKMTAEATFRLSGVVTP